MSALLARILDALATFPGEWLTPWAIARYLDAPADEVVAAVRTLAAEGRVEVNRGV
jgi:DNA-binding IclR family transcriptional regulator